MEITVKRFADNGEASLGVLFVNGIFECFTVEDQEQKGDKVKGETRVPNGTYSVCLRKTGGFDTRYKLKYGHMHKGMLCIHNAKNWKLINNGKEFQYILIHTGNTDDHTMGCLLVNDSVSGATFTGGSSRDAYMALYPKITAAIEEGEKITITYEDIETGK